MLCVTCHLATQALRIGPKPYWSWWQTFSLVDLPLNFREAAPGISSFSYQQALSFYQEHERYARHHQSSNPMHDLFCHWGSIKRCCVQPNSDLLCTHSAPSESLSCVEIFARRICFISVQDIKKAMKNWAVVERSKISQCKISVQKVSENEKNPAI